ncbi:hypothetical protein UlMin_019707 [Ulmus minor]
MASSSSPPKKTLLSTTSSVGGPPQGVKFARRTSSGRIVSLSRDDDLDSLSGDFLGQNDYMNYTVMMPPTPDNQPVAGSSGEVGTTSDPKSDSSRSYGSLRFRSDSAGGDNDGNSGAKMERRMSVMKSSNNQSMLLRSQTGDFDHNRWLFETKGKYGIGNAFWSQDEDTYGPDGVSMSDFLDKPWKPLTRKVKVPAGILSPYRLLVVIRLIVLAFFLGWRVQNPNEEAMWLWGMSIVCEIWFAFSWLLDILPKLNPINRATDLAALRDKFEQPSLSNPKGRSDLPGVDVFVSTADPDKEPPLVTANTILSILAVDYPVEKLSCYISDDGGAILTFEAMAEAVNFAQVWVPFCRKHNIEPRNPDSYFNSKTDPTKNKKQPDFVKDRRWIKREYDEFKVRINGLPEAIRKRSEMYNSKEEAKENKFAREKNGGVLLPDQQIKVTKATWMADGTHWPGTWLSPTADHAKGDHAGILQVMTKVPENESVMGHHDEKKLDFTGVDIRVPMFAYVSREKRPGYDHNKKAGAMNAMVRASAILSNGPFILNLDCDHYIYNSLAIKEGMCFMMDRGGDRICYIQFPQRFEGIDPSDRYGSICTNKLKEFFMTYILHILDIHTTILYSCRLHWSFPSIYNNKKVDNSIGLKNRYEDKTEWGDRIGWIYGSVTEDVVTGYRMHNRGWRSVYCITKRDAFRGTAPINLTDRLHQVLRWATGSVEIFFSRNNAFLASRRLKFLQRVAYLNVGIYPFTSIFLVVYCFLPALSLFSGKFIVQSLDVTFLSYLLTITICLTLLSLLEVKWSGIGLEEWWRNEQFWVIGGTSAHLVAVIQGLLKVIAGIEISFKLTSKSAAEDEQDIYADLYIVKWTSLFIMPLTIIVVNIVAVVIGCSRTLYSVIPQWSKLMGGTFFSFWVLAHMYPFAKGLMGRRGRVPTIVYVWAGLVSITVSLLWISISPPDDTTSTSGGNVKI